MEEWLQTINPIPGLKGHSLTLIVAILFIIVVLIIIGIKNAGSLGYKGKFMKTFDYMRQKLFPALNETTGFLAVSFVVIMCLANVIMKTAPKYMISADKEVEEKTSGFVAWLQTSGLSWLPIVLPIVIVSVMTYLPIDNKFVKIGFISASLLGVFMAALFFGILKNLFEKKKESFGHTDEEFLEKKAADPNNPNAGKHPLDLSIDQDLGIKITTGAHETSATKGKFIKNINVEHWDHNIKFTGEHNATHEIFYSKAPFGSTTNFPEDKVDLKRLPYTQDKKGNYTNVPGPTSDSTDKKKDNFWFFHRIPKNVYVFKGSTKSIVKHSDFCKQSTGAGTKEDSGTGLWEIVDTTSITDFNDYYTKVTNDFKLKNTIKKLSVMTNLKDTSGVSKGYKMLFWGDKYYTAKPKKIKGASKTKDIITNTDTKAFFFEDQLLMFKTGMKGFPVDIFSGKKHPYLTYSKTERITHNDNMKDVNGDKIPFFAPYDASVDTQIGETVKKISDIINNGLIITGENSTKDKLDELINYLNALKAGAKVIRNKRKEGISDKAKENLEVLVTELKNLNEDGGSIEAKDTAQAEVVKTKEAITAAEDEVKKKKAARDARSDTTSWNAANVLLTQAKTNLNNLKTKTLPNKNTILAQKKIALQKNMYKYNEYVKICSEAILSTEFTLGWNKRTPKDEATWTFNYDLYYTTAMYNDAVEHDSNAETPGISAANKKIYQARAVVARAVKPVRVKAKIETKKINSEWNTNLIYKNGHCQIVKYNGDDLENTMDKLYFHVVPKDTKVFTYDQYSKLHEDTWYELNAEGLYDLYDYQDVEGIFVNGFPVTKINKDKKTYSQVRSDIIKLDETHDFIIWGDYQYKGFDAITNPNGSGAQANHSGNFHLDLTISTKPSDIITTEFITDGTIGGDPVKKVFKEQTFLHKWDVGRKIGSMIHIKDQKLYLQTELNTLKDSFGASYIIYYVTVWASIGGYILVTGFQNMSVKKALELFKRLLPFIGVNLLETLMVAHSQYTFDKQSTEATNIDDVNKISSMYTYAVGAYATRIATVVAFLSYILTHAKEG